jgi:hypothetical protein
LFFKDISEGELGKLKKMYANDNDIQSMEGI